MMIIKRIVKGSVYLLAKNADESTGNTAGIVVVTISIGNNPRAKTRRTR